MAFLLQDDDGIVELSNVVLDRREKATERLFGHEDDLLRGGCLSMVRSRLFIRLKEYRAGTYMCQSGSDRYLPYQGRVRDGQ